MKLPEKLMKWSNYSVLQFLALPSAQCSAPPASRTDNLKMFCNISKCCKKMLQEIRKIGKMLQSQCCKNFRACWIVAKFMLQGIWEFLQHLFFKCCKKKNLWGGGEISDNCLLFEEVQEISIIFFNLKFKVCTMKLMLIFAKLRKYLGLVGWKISWL